MADQKWEDWDNIKRAVAMSKLQAQQLLSELDRLEELKIAIMDNPARKAEMKKLADMDPDLSLAVLTAKYLKFKGLRDYLMANIFV